MKTRRIVGTCVLLGISALALLRLGMAAEDKGPPAAQPEKARPERRLDDALRQFMRIKLNASGKVLEGLAVEDFDLLKEGAQTLNEMSQAEQWRVSNDALYRNFSGDFQRMTADLVKAAEEENLDRVALKWVDVTLSCIECHRYARGILIASAQSPQ
jgi:hypothetical protein